MIPWVVFSLLTPATRPPVRPAVAPVVSLVDSASAATASFNWLWRFYWEMSSLRSLGAATWPPPPPDPADPRAKSASTALVYYDPARRRLLHCHPDGAGSFSRPDTNIIRSGWGNRAICPSWVVGGTVPWDERLGIDAEIRPELLPGLRIARDSLLDLLDRATAQAPNDDWIAGERVRFALDQGDTARALAAAHDCRAQPGWCAALHAYVRYGRHEIAAADSEFQTALRLLPLNERCAWSDLGVLLGLGSSSYGRLSCDDRVAVNERIWWLSAPLYTEPGNERRAEHYARMVEIRLRSTDSPAERWDWSEGDGGVAVREMMARYGRPAFSYWLGHDEDLEHYHYLGVGVLPMMKQKDSVTMSAGLFATAEYPLDRYHLVPAWSAIDDPWHASASDWSVWSAPRFDADSVDVGAWPREHAPHAAGPLVQLGDQQTGLFRRESDIAMAVATDLPGVQIGRADGDTIDGVLIVSPGPNTFRFQRQRSVVGSTVIMQSRVAPSPHVVGVEFPGTRTAAAARIRFGITPPAPLSALRPKEIAISEPVLIHGGAAREIPPTDASVAIPRMYGGTAFVAGRVGRVGVYWETYGIDAGDTVDVALRVSPRTPVTALHRFAARLHIVPPASTGVTAEWREPSSAHVVTTTLIGGRVVQGRGIDVDLSALTPGEYVIAVSVARPGGVPVTAARPFSVRSR